MFQGPPGDGWIFSDSRGSGGAAIEGTVRSVLSPRLAHKTGLNRQEIIAFLSHFCCPLDQPTQQVSTGKMSLLVSHILCLNLPTKQGSTGKRLLPVSHIFVSSRLAHKTGLNRQRLLPCCHIYVAPIGLSPQNRASVLRDYCLAFTFLLPPH